MKFLFSGDHGVPFLAASNLSLAALHTLLSSLQPILNTLLIVGQVAVAAATVYYILRKARAVPEPKPKRKRKKQHD